MISQRPTKPSVIWSVLAVAAAIAIQFATAQAQAGWAIFATGKGSAAHTCTIRTSDGTTETLSLDTSCTKTYKTELGTNVIVIEDNSVRIAKADCTNQLCVQMGAISQAGEQIVCLPHRFYIVIDDETGMDGYDTVSR